MQICAGQPRSIRCRKKRAGDLAAVSIEPRGYRDHGPVTSNIEVGPARRAELSGESSAACCSALRPLFSCRPPPPPPRPARRTGASARVRSRPVWPQTRRRFPKLSASSRVSDARPSAGPVRAVDVIKSLLRLWRRQAALSSSEMAYCPARTAMNGRLSTIVSLSWCSVGQRR
jgi:hypothetical protein